MDKIISHKNVLLVKDDVGKGKPATFKLPDKSFSYGKGVKSKGEGAGAICTSWKSHENSIIPGEIIPIDFKKVNKYEATSGEHLKVNVSI